MSGEQIFLVVVFSVIAVVAIAVGITYARSHSRQIKRFILHRLELMLQAVRRASGDEGRHLLEGEPINLSEEERSRAELERLRHFIERRKQIAREADISYHLWDFYRGHFRNADAGMQNDRAPDGEWYDVKMVRARTANGLNEFDFELKGARYRFADDEEQQGWRENFKFFSLFLYDAAGRCLIEVPVKMRVDRNGKHYSVLSDGPNAFLPGEWVTDFINVKLKQQSIRNQEIRAQKHQERLWEIEDLKDRFGLRD